MPLRGGTPAPAARMPASLTTSAFDSNQPTALAELRGAGVSGLSASAKRRLLALMLVGPRSSRPVHGVGADGWPLALYLALQLPARRVVESWSGWAPMGIGVVGRGCRSLALVAMWPPVIERGPSTARLLAFGERDAEDVVDQVLGGWSSRGRPAEENLGVTVSFDGDEGRIRHRWTR